MKHDDEAKVPSGKRLFVLLCEDMPEHSIPFVKNRPKHFDVEVCSDIRCLLAALADYENNRDLPDVLLLDVFSKLDGIDDDANFRQERQTIDSEVRTICEMIEHTNNEARKILAPYGIHFLKRIRDRYSECRLPIMLYSRLGPYILTSSESHDVDLYNAQFLLKYLDYSHQYSIIENFYCKWHSNENPLSLEISRKLSALPTDLADGVEKLLEDSHYGEAIRTGFLVLTEFLRRKFESTMDGSDLCYHMIRKLSLHDRYDDFAKRAKAACCLYNNIYVLKGCPYFHNLYGTLTREEVRELRKVPWREADMCLSIYTMIWREIEDVLKSIKP